MNSKDWLIGCGIMPNAAIIKSLDDALAIQRQWCFDRVKKVAIGMYFSSAAMSDNEILADFEDACLNATGEKE